MVVRWVTILPFCCTLLLCFNVYQNILPPQARGFELSYLSKLSQVRDTHTRQPLLHHVCVLLLQLRPDSSDLHSDIAAVTKAAKVGGQSCDCHFKY